MENATIVLPSELNIAGAKGFRDKLLETPPEVPVVIDGTNVSRIDGTGVQLLLALTHKLETEGRTWSWSGYAGCVERAVQTLAVTNILRLSGGEE